MNDFASKLRGLVPLSFVTPGPDARGGYAYHSSNFERILCTIAESEEFGWYFGTLVAEPLLPCWIMLHLKYSKSQYTGAHASYYCL